MEPPGPGTNDVQLEQVKNRIVDLLNLDKDYANYLFSFSKHFDRSKSGSKERADETAANLKAMDQCMTELALMMITSYESQNTAQLMDIKDRFTGMWGILCIVFNDPTPDRWLDCDVFGHVKSIQSYIKSTHFLKSHIAHAHSEDVESARKRPKTEATIPTSNRFENLNSDVPADVPDVHVTMDTTPPTDTSNNTQNTQSIPKNSRLESLFIPLVKGWQNVITQLKTVTTSTLRTKVTGDMLKISPSTVEDFRALQAYCVEKKQPFHAIVPRNERPAKVLIRGLPIDMEITQIADDLLAANITPERIIQLRNRKTKDLMPLFLVHIKTNPGWDAVYKLEFIFGIDVTVTKFTVRGIKQCYNCQGYSHSSFNCTLPPRCVKCGGSHKSSDCGKPADVPPTCALCGGSHPASYRGCPKNPENRRKLVEKIKSAKNQERVPAPAPLKPAWQNTGLTKDDTHFPALPGSAPANKRPPAVAATSSETNAELNKTGTCGGFGEVVDAIKSITGMFKNVSAITALIKDVATKLTGAASPLDKIFILLESVGPAMELFSQN